jgi:hypothetical protein
MDIRLSSKQPVAREGTAQSTVFWRRLPTMPSSSGRLASVQLETRRKWCLFCPHRFPASRRTSIKTT